MLTKEYITKLASDHLPEKVFLVDVQVRTGNKILVEIDRPGGLDIDDCVKVSRGIEFSLDRDKEDFELQVASPGADAPFKVKDQYFKNVDKEVEVTDNENKKIKGILKEVKDDSIVIEESLKRGKEKKATELKFSQIKKTHRTISFK